MSMFSDYVRGDGGVGLTERGAQKAVKDHCEIEAFHRRARTRSFRSVKKMYRRLIERDGAVATDDLLDYFEPAERAPDRQKGHYNEYMEDEWMEDVGAPALQNLPGVRYNEGSDTWRFVGLSDPEEYEDQTAPLEEIRSSPAVVAKNALDDLGVPPGTDRREGLLSLYVHLARSDSETSTTEDLDRVLSRESRPVSVEEIADTLEELPGVSREQWSPPAPEDIEVETMADVLAGHDALDEEPTDTWSYTPPGD